MYLFSQVYNLPVLKLCKAQKMKSMLEPEPGKEHFANNSPKGQGSTKAYDELEGRDPQTLLFPLYPENLHMTWWPLSKIIMFFTGTFLWQCSKCQASDNRNLVSSFKKQKAHLMLSMGGHSVTNQCSWVIPESVKPCSVRTAQTLAPLHHTNCQMPIGLLIFCMGSHLLWRTPIISCYHQCLMTSLQLSGQPTNLCSLFQCL